MVTRDTVAGFSKLVENLSHQLHAVTRLFEEGEGTRTAIAVTESRLANARAELERSKAAQVSAQARLQSLILKSPGNLSWPSMPRVQSQGVDVALADHPR